MPKPRASTRDRILSAAIKLFRERGFEQTTMRDIAKAAKTSLGSAYYYFPRKESLVLAHYDDQTRLLEQKLEAVFAETSDPAQRVRAAFTTRFEQMRGDRKFLGGLFRLIGEPGNPGSVFSEETRHLRQRGVLLMRRALDVPSIPEDVRHDGAVALWALFMALSLYFLYDDSPNQQQTWQLTDGLLGTLVPFLPLAGMPVVSALRSRLRGVLGDAGLLPDLDSAASEAAPGSAQGDCAND